MATLVVSSLHIDELSRWGLVDLRYIETLCKLDAIVICYECVHALIVICRKYLFLIYGSLKQAVELFAELFHEFWFAVS